MLIEGKYIWIWELDKCDNGNISKIINTAKNIGLNGYIIKTHDGSNFLSQSQAINEFKNSGLKVGTWGYCYGNNVDGEVEAINKTASFKPDFYVMDIESEFEPANMYSVAEQMLIKLKNIGVPLGYTSFAIPGYHSVPFDIFSKYCKFTMPQIYWRDMGWQVDKAFQTSYDEYGKYSLPIYPIGQITNGVPQNEIIDFNSLCLDRNIAMISYWNYQNATETQLNAIKESNDQDFLKAVDVLKRNSIIQSPEYWIENAAADKTVKGEYARILIERMAARLNSYK